MKTITLTQSDYTNITKAFFYYLENEKALNLTQKEIDSILFVLHLYYRLRFVLALQDRDPDNLAGHFVAVAFAQIVIQMLLVSKLFNSAVVIA